MSIYAPLAMHLSRQTSSELPLKFEDIEALIGRALPRTAYERPQFWSNNQTRRVHAQAWRSAGWKTRNVNLTTHTVIFERENRTLPTRLAAASALRAAAPKVTSADIPALIREDRNR